jgi:hypothetical protein
VGLDNARGAIDAVFLLLDPMQEMSISFARKIARKIAVHSSVPMLLILNKA